MRVVGVEPADAASMAAAFAANGPVMLDHVGIFADGVAVREVGEETYRLCAEHLDEIITVGTDQICAAMQAIYEDTRTVVEPAGALAVAGILADGKRPSENKNAVAIVCGANMNFDRLRHVVERASTGLDSEGLFAVTIPEQPGSFLKFAEALRGFNITEFNYRMAESKKARIFVGISTEHRDIDRSTVAGVLDRAGYKFLDLTDSELAKLHIRHLAAGSGSANDEKLYRFRFPERQGALHDFLLAIGSEWNISLFHYRNHASDYGRVLVGIQVPSDTQTELEAHLAKLGFDYTEETEDPAYQLFLV